MTAKTALFFSTLALFLLSACLPQTGVASEAAATRTSPPATRTSPPATRTSPPATRTSPLSPTVQNWVDEAKADLALRQETAAEQIELLSFEDKVWPDAGLGCPQPGMRYAQVMVEGYLIRLQAGEQIYNYHGGSGRGPFLCEEPGPQIVITKQAPFDLKQTPTISVPPPRD